MADWSAEGFGHNCLAVVVGCSPGNWIADRIHNPVGHTLVVGCILPAAAGYIPAVDHILAGLRNPAAHSPAVPALRILAVLVVPARIQIAHNFVDILPAGSLPVVLAGLATGLVILVLAIVLEEDPVVGVLDILAPVAIQEVGLASFLAEVG